MSKSEELIEKYYDVFPETMTFEEVSQKLESMTDSQDVVSYRRVFCNNMVYVLTSGYTEYEKSFDITKLELGKLLLYHIKKLPKTETFYWMLYSMYTKDYKNCILYFDKDVASLSSRLEGAINEGLLIEAYIEPMKNAFPGFWKHAQERLSPLCESDGTHELCSLMDAVYSREGDEAGVDILSAYIQKYPDIVCAKEYIGCIYYNLKKWNNAIAYFESVDNPMIFANCSDELYFMLGYAYGKIKDYSSEEIAYKKCLEIFPEREFARNNLAYCLYKQKKLLEAKSILENCIESGSDMPFAANNYVRVLVALGRNKDVQDFVKSNKFKVLKTLVDKVKKLDSSNKRLAKKDVLIELDDASAEAPDKGFIESKGSQFTTEKILEDELTARIEAGTIVFGKRLKIYKRKGIYGRQFIIPIGRLDLLCEDDNGDLYIIELKKDSGYDDAYKQTAEYLDWFEKNWKEHKNIHGIICLNDPSKNILDKVHADKRMQVFEYQVSYIER